ncbi:MAG: aspartate/glutamate racemase family protein [Devosiaceae bacterium]|nr:aspartate/glutamate racemase family protein [Devosiaceae bacterium MH13]
MPEATHKTIGVLGGMGPQATIQFMQRVVDAVPANDDADHVPLLVDQNPAVPSRIAALIDGDGENPGPTLAFMARRLESAGAAAIVMPCNTAHAFTAEIAAAVSVPFLSMVELSAQALAANHPGAKVGMLASPAVKLAAVFDAPLAKHGLTPVYADDQDALLGAIRALKRDGSDAAACTTTLAAMDNFRAQGADIVLVSCSEFSLLSATLGAHAPIIDSLDVLVDATVAFSRFGAVQPHSPLFAAHEPGAGTNQFKSGSTTREAAQ